MKQSFQQKYNDSLKLLSHLILTKPEAVIRLLTKHGIIFKGNPTRKQLIDEVVELLRSESSTFENDLGSLLTTHISYRGKEMLELDRSRFHSYSDEEDEDAFWGALAKGAVGIIGGLIGKKKRRRRSRGGGGTNAAAQAVQTKRDMQLLSIRMAESKRRREEERRRREAEERRRREEAERRRREEQARREREAAKARQNRTMLIAGGGIALLAVVGVFMAKSNPRPAIPYTPSQPVMSR